MTLVGTTVDRYCSDRYRLCDPTECGVSAGFCGGNQHIIEQQVCSLSAITSHFKLYAETDVVKATAYLFIAGDMAPVKEKNCG